MTLRDGDTIWPHHPDDVSSCDGDLPVNNRPGDVWYLLVDELDGQDIAWDILNNLVQSTSWHIHPSTIEFIAQFILKYIESEFTADQIKVDFDAPVYEPYQAEFTLREPLVSNFDIYRVLFNTRQP